MFTLTYTGDTGTVSTYDAHANGKLVFVVMVDNNDPTLTINLVSVAGQAIETKGRARLKHDSEQINKWSIVYYLKPRLAHFLVEFYLPQA